MSKEKVLHNPLMPRRVMKTQKEWTFNAPSYDNRTSCSISAGEHYGVGHRTPVGKTQASSYESGPIPLNSHSFDPDDIVFTRDNAG